MTTSPEEASPPVPPSSFVCPLTLEVMSDPLISIHGHNFQREAILEWLARGNNTCPLTRKLLFIDKLIANKSLQAQIKRWKINNGLEDYNMTPVDDPYYINKRLGLMCNQKAYQQGQQHQPHAPQQHSRSRIRALILNSFTRSRR
jgi:hypothetical protein